MPIQPLLDFGRRYEQRAGQSPDVIRPAQYPAAKAQNRDWDRQEPQGTAHQLTQLEHEFPGREHIVIGDKEDLASRRRAIQAMGDRTHEVSCEEEAARIMDQTERHRNTSVERPEQPEEIGSDPRTVD
jgi:hypothetical protein